MSTKPDSSQIKHETGTLKDIADASKPLADYTALRAYTGTATTVRITSTGIAGFFTRDSDVVTADNGVTVIVDGSGRRWKRAKERPVSAFETYGTFEQACAASVQANQGVDVRPAVSGLTSSAALSNFPSRDSVALYVDNANPAPLHDVADAGTVYTATSVSFPAAISTDDLKVGMIVDTKHAPKWSGFLQSWTTNSLTVQSWNQVGGSFGTPANGTGVIVNPVTKAWSLNANLRLSDSSQYSSQGSYLEGSIVELGLLDTSTKGTQPLTVAIDAAVLNTRDGKFAYWARGASRSSAKWTAGYVAWDHSDAGFKAQYGKSGSNNFESIGIGETSDGTFTGAGFYDFNSLTSFMAQPSSGGNAYLVRAPNGAINRYQVADTGKVSIRTTDASRAISVKSQDDATEYFGVNSTGQIGPFAASTVTVTALTYTVVGGNHVVICSTGSSGGTVTLVNAATFPGRLIEVVNRSGGSITVTGVSGQQIDSSATATVANLANSRFLSTGSAWLNLS